MPITTEVASTNPVHGAVYSIQQYYVINLYIVSDLRQIGGFHQVLMARYTHWIQHYVIKVCQWLATSRCFLYGTPVSSTNKSYCHDITEILLKVALNTINLNPTLLFISWYILFFNNDVNNFYRKLYVNHCWYTVPRLI